MKTYPWKVILAATGLLLLPLTSHAAVISQFNFTGNTLTSSDSEPSTTSSSISFGSGIDGTITNAVAGAVEDVLRINAIATNPQGPTTQSLSAQVGFAINNNQYFTYTVTAPFGVTLNLTQLTFDYNVVNPYRLGMGVFTDKTGFAFADLLGTGVYTSTAGSYPQAIDLSSVSELQGLTDTTVEFRIYIGDASTSETRWYNFDNIVLSGTVDVIPEPTAALLGSLGLLALLRRRRA